METRIFKRVIYSMIFLNVVLVLMIVSMAYMVIKDNEEPIQRNADLCVSNNIGQQVMAEVYVLNDHNWDYYLYVLNDGDQVNFNIDWMGDNDITVFCVYTFGDEKRSFRYVVSDGERFTDMLI